MEQGEDIKEPSNLCIICTAYEVAPGICLLNNLLFPDMLAMCKNMDAEEHE